MRIEKLVVADALGGFFYDDQAAIGAGARRDGDVYLGEPVTAGFRAIRMPASALGIGLLLERGTVVWGDAMSVQYAGAAGRDAVFDRSEQKSILSTAVAPRVAELDVRRFRFSAEWVAALRFEGRPLHVGLQYGLTQALLRAGAVARGVTMAEVIAAEFGLPLVARAVPIHCQSGDARERNTERMILKRADSLPHGLINSVAAFGLRGERFMEFVAWVAARVLSLGDADYKPTLHFDLYGSVGRAFGLRISPIVDYLAAVGQAAAPFKVRVESPVDFGGRGAQIDGCAELVETLASRGSEVQIVVDEWCNTVDDVEAFAKAGAAHMIQIKAPDLGGLQQCVKAVQLCHEHNVAAYLGGSCTETDFAAQVCVHLAVATQADLQLAKPGMGVDEGLMTVRNEQARLLAQLAER